MERVESRAQIWLGLHWDPGLRQHSVKVSWAIDISTYLIVLRWSKQSPAVLRASEGFNYPV